MSTLQDALTGLVIFGVVTAMSIKWGKKKQQQAQDPQEQQPERPQPARRDGADNARAEHRPKVEASQGARAVKPPPAKISHGAKVPPNKVDL